MKFFTAFFTLTLLATLTCGKILNSNIKVLLIAGSSSWENYRHQADIGHAYKTLVERNIAKENIVVFAYDDIANNPMNPFPGKIFNHPSLKEDVYAGLEIDYKGDDVNENNFLCALSGDKSCLKGVGTGRVVESTENDDVFVYYADHGAYGILGLPNGVIQRDNIMATLNKMNQDKKFRKLVFYIEACESGSIFENLETDVNIFGVTASFGNESSYAAYCSGDHGLPCLGDEFSVNWIENSQVDYDEKYLIKNQVDTVKTKTLMSHVQRYGDCEIPKEELKDFQGEFNCNHTKSSRPKVGRYDTNYYPMVSSRDADMKYYQNMINSNLHIKLRLNAMLSLEKLEKTKRNNANIVKKITDTLDLDFDILQNQIPVYNKITDEKHNILFKHIQMSCGNIGKNTDMMKYSKLFYNICSLNIDMSDILSAISFACQQ
ncbi:Legumain [Strongyloides ratti]|uniref:legumain n=1 Tax=Strongyloides ratti TaxID=34506 RepID=A0A090LJN1_STRRB|nr:Legumain [Strongyloides ratti]CEF69923.1 Legumain [Strongyloides ratti]